VDEAVVEHTTLITEAQGDIETLIAAVRRRDGEVAVLQRQITGLCHLVDQLLTWVTVLEGRRDSPIELPDSPMALPVWILPPAEYRLVPIKDLGEEEEDEGVDLDEVFRVRPGEEYMDGETILDVLWRRNQRENTVPEYEEPPRVQQSRIYLGSLDRRI